MAKEPFSMHSGLRPRPETPVYGEVPERIRTAFIYLLRDFVKYASIYTPFGQRLGKLVPLPGSILGAIQLKIVDLEVEKMVTGCAWYEFYDLCEEAYKHIHDTSKWDAEEFTKNLNKIFTEESIGYKLVRGSIKRVGVKFADEKQRQASLLLRAGKFKGPDQQFQKAIRALNVRPQPDTENCIKDAVGALEGVARIVTGDEKSTLGDLLDKKLVPTIIPKPLHKAFEAVYGYRSTTPGIGHGQVEASTVMLEDAELVLGLCAAMIIYLAKKK